MGWRFHKTASIGIFKIHFSKSGISYGIRFGGLSITKTAKGDTRVTSSIRGLGLSYVTTIKGKNKSKPSEMKESKNSSSLDVIKSYGGAESATSVNKLILINKINKFIFINRVLNFLIPISFFLFLISPYFAITNKELDSAKYSIIVSIILVIMFGSIIFKIIYRFFIKVRVEYSFDDYGNKYLNEFNKLIENLVSCDTVWEIKSIIKNDPRMKTAAKTSVNEEKMNVKKRKPYFIKSNIVPYSFLSKNTQYYLFPDMLFVINKGKFSAFDYKELKIRAEVGRLQLLKVPSDATIVGSNWQHVNRDGTADKRFRNNFKLSVIMIPELFITTNSGLDSCFYLSNVNKGQQFITELKVIIEKYKDYAIIDEEE